MYNFLKNHDATNCFVCALRDVKSENVEDSMPIPTGGIYEDFMGDLK